MVYETLLLMITAGIVATAVGDLATFCMELMGLAKSKWGMVGRWLAGLTQGRLVNPHLATSPAVSGESLLGWGFHYLTGIVYGILYIGLCMLAGHKPELVSAVLFGLATVAAPYFILMPGMGAGVLARKTPNPLKACLLSLTVHVCFGLGLAAGVTLFKALL